MADVLTPLPFMKMHGLGNDFVVVDLRDGGRMPSTRLVCALADRHRGVGFDQLAVIADHASADLEITYYNADGSTSAACGNATRCIAERELARTGHETLAIEVTGRGALSAVRRATGVVAVNMGHPLLSWQDVPLAEEMDTLTLPLAGGPSATGMGNPHCTFFVEDAEAVDLATRGPEVENHPLFPERTNVQFATVLSNSRIRMRVWERGTGITLASGSSSCATAVAAARRGLTGRQVEIVLDGGSLQIDWREDGVWMSGPTAHVFDGTLTPEFLAAL
ncbi:MAG: diaminopimelate epimerase [Rhodobacteraceae bacterium]|nr:diaminopimelate epimerase [Paracoccaceae bacterium]